MKLFYLATCAVAIVLVASSIGNSQRPKTANQEPRTSNQLLMRDKLLQMNRVLEGITLNKFDQVQESAKTLGMISRAASWHISDPTPQYERMTKDFQEQALDLERHAKEQNAEAATLDLVRISITCTHCHQHMRESGAKPN